MPDRLLAAGVVVVEPGCVLKLNGKVREKQKKINIMISYMIFKQANFCK